MNYGYKKLFSLKKTIFTNALNYKNGLILENLGIYHSIVKLSALRAPVTVLVWF